MRRFLAAALLSLAIPAAAAKHPAIPKVDVVYPPFGTIFDRTCGSFMKSHGPSNDQIEAAGRLRARLQEVWDAEGPKYLAAAFDEIGAEFPYGEVQVYLTTCDLSAMSGPIMVNVSRFLPGAAHGAPIEEFVEDTFHELMHNYTMSVRGSAMRRKYAKEPPIVVNHLHVMALEKFVLTKLGKKEMLASLEKGYATDPQYERAWQIMNAEGEKVFLDELKAKPELKP